MKKTLAILMALVMVLVALLVFPLVPLLEVESVA